MEKIPTLGERIRYIREFLLKQNQTVFAEKLGFSRLATISDYEKNKRNPDIETLREIASLGEVKIEWLLTGDGPISVHEQPASAVLARDSGQAYSEGYAEAQVYDMTSVKGPWEFPGVEPIDVIIAPRRDLLKGQTPLRVRGDSMAPAIIDGATVGVDIRDKRVVSGAVYAVWLNYEGVTIKRLFIFHDRIVLKPDNPYFPETAIPIKNIGEEFIIGKVVWLYQRYP